MFSFSFDDFSLASDEMLIAAVRMFQDSGFTQEFHIDLEVNNILIFIRDYLL